MIKAKEKSGNNSSLLETRKRKLIEKFDSLGGEGINFSFLDLDKATFSSILRLLVNFLNWLAMDPSPTSTKCPSGISFKIIGIASIKV